MLFAGRSVMKLRYFFHISPLLLPLAAAAAQTPPCSALSPDEALFARVAGACRDPAPIVDKASKGAAIVEKGSRAGKTAGRRTRQGDLPLRAAPMSAVAETFEMPNVVDRTDAAAADTLAEFKVHRVLVPSATPSGTVVAQQPDPGFAISPGATVTLGVSDGSLAAAATLSEPAPAPSTTGAATNDPRPVALRWLIIAGASLLVLVIGGSIRRWWRSHAIEPHVGSADTSPAPAASAVTADDFRFAAHLDAGEVRVELAGPAKLQETSDEDSSVHHA